MRNQDRLIIPFLAIAIIGLSACRKPAASQQNANSNAAPAFDAPAGGAAPTGEKFYFRGTIANNLRIEMTLVRDAEGLNGSYFYPKVGKDIEIKGTIDKDGNLELKEFDESGKETGVFKGKWKSVSDPVDLGLSGIEGKWSKPDGSKGTNFELAQQPIEFAAAVRVAPKLIRESNKELHYTIDVEYPQIEGDARFDKFNREARGMITKEVAAWKTGETAVEADSDADLPSETQDSSLMSSYQVRLATDDLISVEFDESTYSRGAAHPNSYTTVLNYDVRNGKKLSLADLFKPKSNYLSVISAFCIKDLKQKDKESMLGEVDSGAAPRADNYKAWTITKKGLWITFDPYQVGPYAAGPQHVLVPYSVLKDIIKPDGPVAAFAK